MLVVLGVAALAAYGASRLASHATASGPTALAGTFAPGACVELGPTQGNRHETVFLDAGHGGPDPGSIGVDPAGQRVEEKQFTLPVELATGALLRSDGYTVVLSRTVDGPVAALGPGDLDGTVLTAAGEHADLAARVRCANEAHAAVLVSIHFNAFSDPNVGGALTTYDAARSFSAENERLASLLERDVVASLARGGWDVPARGVTPDTNVGGPALTAAGAAYDHLYLLGPRAPGFNDDPSDMPGALVEPLFITDPAETAILEDPAGREAIASGIAEAIEQFLAAR